MKKPVPLDRGWRTTNRKEGEGREGRGRLRERGEEGVRYAIYGLKTEIFNIFSLWDYLKTEHSDRIKQDCGY